MLDFLKSGSKARLFPVLSTTSKEGRTTSIVLSCMSLVREFGAELLGSLGQRVGKRASIECFTEVVFNDAAFKDCRPDGLIILRTGRSEWRALVETKVGNATLSTAQLEKYRLLAKNFSIDCVITVSNQFSASPQVHPQYSELSKRLKIPVYHWSWMFILTTADLLYSSDKVADSDQKLLLNELRRFLAHDSAGVQGFTRMPPEWAELVKLASTGGEIPKSSALLPPVVDAWHQESKDLALILSRRLDVPVNEKLSRKASRNAASRDNDTMKKLLDRKALDVSFDIPDAAAPLDVTASLPQRLLTIGMTIRAPEDRVSNRARLNWLLRHIKTELSDDYLLRFHWPGRCGFTQVTVEHAKADPDIINTDREHLKVHTFEVVRACKLGARFGQLENFVTDLEQMVPEFYENVGQHLQVWVKPAPKISGKSDIEDIEIEAEEDAASSHQTSNSSTNRAFS